VSWPAVPEHWASTDQALMMDGRTRIPADWIATTNGEAEAPPLVPFAAAWASSGLQ